MQTTSNKVTIAHDVEWEVVNKKDLVSAFPEKALDQLALAGLDKVVKQPTREGLSAALGPEFGKRGSVGRVYKVKGDNGLVVKIHNRPFSYTGINAALEAGLVSHPQYSTPNYLGAIFTSPNTQATIMTKVHGKELSDLKRSLNPRQILNVEDEIANKQNIIATGKSALDSVGVDPELAWWDLNDNNLLVPHAIDSFAQTHSMPITIIDQQASKIGDIDDWEWLARPPFDPLSRDPRDIDAEDASEAAWEGLTAGNR